jgi:hypothetical protein
MSVTARCTSHHRGLLARGVRVVGTDGWNWDAPFSFRRERVKQTGDVGLIWEGHRAGRDIGYFQMEKLGNLHAAAGCL